MAASRRAQGLAPSSRRTRRSPRENPTEDGARRAGEFRNSLTDVDAVADADAGADTGADTDAGTGTDAGTHTPNLKAQAAFLHQQGCRLRFQCGCVVAAVVVAVARRLPSFVVRSGAATAASCGSTVQVGALSATPPSMAAACVNV
jgi:hypothetical protein